MLFLDTNFKMSKIVRKEGIIEFRSADGEIPFYFKVETDKVTLFCKDTGAEESFTNDIFIKACYNNGKYTFNIQLSDGDDTLSLDPMANPEYYMIPLTKEDSAVRSTKNRNKIKEYESFISKNRLIMYPEDINMAIDQSNKANDNNIHLSFWKDGFFGSSPMKISLRESVFPSYNQVKYSTKYGMIEYTKHICNRLPVENIVYNVAVYDSINNILISYEDIPEECIDMNADKPINHDTPVDTIDDVIDTDFDDQPQEANIIIPHPSDMWLNWTKSVMMYVDKPKQIKIHALTNFSNIIFDFESPVQVICKTIKNNIKMLESYALNMFDINRMALRYDFGNEIYSFIFSTTTGYEIDYNQLPFLPSMKEDMHEQIYITIANRCVIINDSPYLDNNNKVLSYINAREYLSR